VTDGDHLYRAILAHPDEDTPRLAYADWLDENAADIECGACMGFRFNGLGEYRKPCAHCDSTGFTSDGRRERAEFIRVQCRLATPCVTCTPVCSQEYGHAPPCELGLVGDLRRRERELWLTLYNKFTAEGGRGLNVPHSTADGCSVNYLPQSREPGIRLTWKRGFVAEAHLPAAAFLGGGCGRCYQFGSRRVINNPNPRRGSSAIVICPDCDGTGRIPGLAKTLFSRHPIERVVLTDVRAICGARSNLYFTAIVDQNGFVAYPDQPPFPRKTYATAAECEADLSAALVAYGRRLAGLPPLPVKEDARV
jgi:uncharacterized protein (TIGR02996 family)